MLHYFKLFAGDGLILSIFVLGFLALPYSPDMRKVFGRLPILGGWVRRTDAAQFVLLKRIHGDAYQLMVVIIGRSIKLLIRWVALGVAVLIAYDIANFLSLAIVTDERVFMLIVALAFGCPILGIIQWIFWTRKLVLDLGDYDEAVHQVSEAARVRHGATL